jgi:hypothetical protein
MKTKFVSATISKVTFIGVLFLTAFSCQKDISKDTKLQTVSLNQYSVSPHIPPYNLDVALNGTGKGVGLLKFKQNKDSAKIINLDTWVWHLQPNHPYLLQRAVDSIQYGGCLSTTWLTLGLGLQPQSIKTDANGNGHADLWRDVSAVSSGTEFYIHFQVIDSVSAAVTLTSDCYTYTVR